MAVCVSHVDAGSAAAGLVQVGDTIVAANGVAIYNFGDIRRVLEQSDAFSWVTLLVLRNEREVIVDVEVPESRFLGIITRGVSTLDASVGPSSDSAATASDARLNSDQWIEGCLLSVDAGSREREQSGVRRRRDIVLVSVLLLVLSGVFVGMWLSSRQSPAVSPQSATSQGQEKEEVQVPVDTFDFPFDEEMAVTMVEALIRTQSNDSKLITL